MLGGINTKVSTYTNQATEFRDIQNLHFTTPNALTKRQGSTLYLGATISGRITGLTEFQRLSGSSYIISTANTNAYSVTSSYNVIKTGLKNNALFDFVTFVDRLFSANGQDFFKFDGVNTYNFSLPPGATSGFGVTALVGGTLNGTYLASYGYLNERGYFGPAAPGATIVLNGTTFGSIGYYGMTTPPGFGVTAIALYRTTAGGVDLVGTTFAPINTDSVTDPGWPLSTRLANFNLYFTMAPRYMEIYNNQLMLAGFSSALSTLYWSDIGEPESIDPTFFAEFRTNDGDRITTLKTYNNAMIVAKERSFHRLTGDNPSDFLVQEISDQYGCLSNRAAVVFENKLWFLDTKGVVEYNGANIAIVSNRIESIFLSMNIDAARDNAVAIHYRDFNEVWFAIPINGSTTNNAIVIYDYIADAWTRYTGLFISSLFVGQGNLTSKAAIYGGYTGNIFYFDKNLMGDSGQGITCSFATRFHTDRGQTTENMWRRFYMDVDPILGITQPISINFRTNYGTTNVLSRTMYQNPFQSRVDFGLASRSIQVEMVHYSATLSIKVNGYSLESRFQRNV